MAKAKFSGPPCVNIGTITLTGKTTLTAAITVLHDKFPI